MQAGTNIIKEIFRHTNEQEVAELLVALGELLKSVNVRRYPPGYTLCHEHKVENVFYIIAQGEVAIFKELTQGSEKTLLARKVAGEFFGEMALVLDSPRTADVVTTQESILIELERETFIEATLRSPAIAQIMKQVTIEQLDRHKRKSEAQRGEQPKSVSVFTSYSRQDQSFVLNLVRNLRLDAEKSSISLWLDQEMPLGTKWDREVQRALEHCDAMLLILSGSAIESDNVSDEWNYYLEKKKPIIPILISNCDIPFRLRRLQHIDFKGLEYEIALARIHAALINVG